MYADGRSTFVIAVSLIGSLAVAHWFALPFQERRGKQQELKSIAAFVVAFDANGSV